MEPTEPLRTLQASTKCPTERASEQVEWMEGLSSSLPHLSLDQHRLRFKELSTLLIFDLSHAGHANPQALG